jgi:hypothetical protein
MKDRVKKVLRRFNSGRFPFPTLNYVQLSLIILLMLISLFFIFY